MELIKVGAVTRNIYNFQLMQFADYSDLKKLRFLLERFYELEELGACGDSVAASIWIDLKTALNSDLVSKPQRECLVLVVINGHTLSEVAIKRDITENSVHGLVRRGIVSMQKALKEEELFE